MLVRIFSFRVLVVALAGAMLALAVLTPVFAQTGSYEPGHLFVSVGGGIIRVFDPSGGQIGEIDTETDSAEIGDMCFGPGVMYSMNFSDESISKFDGEGNLIESRWAAIPGAVESCVLDANGNLYVGEDSDTGGLLVRLTPDGEIDKTFAPSVDASGIDQIDLAEDQCTLYYTSEGGGIKRYDVCQDEQLSDFATGIGNSCYGLRIRPNGEVLVACDVSVYRINQGGTAIQTYSPADVSSSGGGLFALNLDNDDQHFFTATYQEGRIWRIDIESGAGAESPYLTTTITGDSIGGLAIFGEITVASPAGASLVDPDRPEIVQSVPDPTQISTEPDVVGTNIAFSIIAVILILLSAQIFNETIEENNSQIERFAKRYVRPLAAPFNGLRSIWRSAFASNPQHSATAAIAVVIGATALVYGFLEPGFKLNKDGLLLVISVVIALGVVTYAYSGMEARVTERRFHLPSGVRVFPVAFGIAIASVLLSRVVEFQPGIIYGFVASNVVLGAGDLAVKQKGQAVFLAAVCLLACFGLAWALMIPAREWAESDANPLAVVLESGSTLIVVGAIQGLAFSMVPIEFTHGMKVWRWSKVAWVLIAFVAAFLFWHVLIVQDSAGFKAIEHGNTVGALAALGFCVGITAAVWGFFYFRRRQEAKAEAEAVSTIPEASIETPETVAETPDAIKTQSDPPNETPSE